MQSVYFRKPSLLRIKDLGKVIWDRHPRRGMLGQEEPKLVGGVVVARYGSNPWKSLTMVKSKRGNWPLGLLPSLLEDGKSRSDHLYLL